MRPPDGAEETRTRTRAPLTELLRAALCREGWLERRLPDGSSGWAAGPGERPRTLAAASRLVVGTDPPLEQAVHDLLLAAGWRARPDGLVDPLAPAADALALDVLHAMTVQLAREAADVEAAPPL